MSDFPRAWRVEAQRLNGLFAGMCDPTEYEYLVKAGLIRLTYEGSAGFMGLAKLQYDPEARP